MDCSPSGSSVHGFSRQEYWGGLPGPPPGDLPNPGIEPASPALLVDSLPFSHESVYSLFLFYVTVLVFLFAAQSWCIPFPCLCVNSFLSLVHPSVDCITLCISVHFLYFYALWFPFGTFLYLPFLCWNPHLVHALFSWLQWVCLCLLISLSGISITSVSLRSVPGVLPYSFETYSFAALFSPTLCVGFGALGETATSPTLDWGGLCSRWESSFSLA